MTDCKSSTMKLDYSCRLTILEIHQRELESGGLAERFIALT